MTKTYNEFASKLSVKLEDNRGITSHRLREITLNDYDAYVLYTEHPDDIRVLQYLQEFAIYTDNADHAEIINKTVKYICDNRKDDKRLQLIKTYIIGLHERGINTFLLTSGVKFYADDNDVKECNICAYMSTSSVNKLTESYNYRSMNNRIYEVLSENQGTLSELRIGDFSACYCLRKLYKEHFPERVSEMYVAGKTIEVYDLQDWNLPKCKTAAQSRRPRVSSAFRELLDDSFDYEFLETMEESATKFDLKGEQLHGQFFYDYRGRMYWSGNINPQGVVENRELSINGHDTIEYDATCSGIQLGSLLAKNVPMMKKCNVISTGTKEKQDAYQYIADMACEEMGLPVGSIPRTVAKKPVMLLPYGAAARTLINHAINAAEEAIAEGKISEEVTAKYDAREIGKRVHRAVEHHVAREATYNRILELIDVKVFSKNGKDYGQYCSWTTPDGLNVNSYSKLPADQINKMLADGADMLHSYKHCVVDLTLGGTQYKSDVMYVEGCNIKFYKNDTPNVGQLVPNFIHSLDATALRFVCKKLLAEGHDVFPVHDCVIVSDEVDQDHISDLFRQAYQFIGDYYDCDITVDGMIVFPE